MPQCPSAPVAGNLPWAHTPTEPGTCHTDLSVERILIEGGDGGKEWSKG